MFRSGEQRRLSKAAPLLFALLGISYPLASFSASYGPVEVKPFGFLDTDGKPVQGITLVSSGGTTYPTVPVPEPSSFLFFLLMSISLGSLRFFRRHRA